MTTELNAALTQYRQILLDTAVADIFLRTTLKPIANPEGMAQAASIARARVVRAASHVSAQKLTEELMATGFTQSNLNQENTNAA
jgi:hypothetical protein